MLHNDLNILTKKSHSDSESSSFIHSVTSDLSAKSSSLNSSLNSKTLATRSL